MGAGVGATSAEYQPPSSSYTYADFVIYGTILSVQDPYETVKYTACEGQVYAQRAKIKIIKHWKKDLGEEEYVLAPGTHAVDPTQSICDISYPLAEGKTVIIFGNLNADGKLATGMGGSNVYEGDVYFSDTLDYLNNLTNVPAPTPSNTTPAPPAEVIPNPTVATPPATTDVPTEDALPSEVVVEETPDVDFPFPWVKTTVPEPIPAPVAPAIEPTPAPSRGIVEQIVDFFRSLFGFK
jgi:hypothetical protein